MKQIDRSSPKPLRDVWAWKDAIYREVKDLPIDQALTAILDRAEQTGQGTKSVARLARSAPSAPERKLQRNR